ncbi:MAG TPA: glycosyltransferase family 2 protein [Fimbriimonadaceae bacterium]|nr:glycosyltransferase family 2 protein [Fimbriimonadaceae bacterium]
MAEEKSRSIAVIIPAKDEEQRIGNVLRAAAASKLATEIVVVSDGSSDRTAEVAARYPGVTVVRLPVNLGKGAAMAKGVEKTKAEIVAFVDADLHGLTAEHIDQIIWPVLTDQCEVCIGIFRGGKFWSDTAQKFAPYISGQRAMKRWIFEATPDLSDLRFGVEYALNYQAKRVKARVLRVVIRGVSNSHKEKKLGIGKGLRARTKMYVEIGQAMVKTRKKRKPPRGFRWK